MRETLSARLEATARALGAREPGDWTSTTLESSPDGRAVVEFRSGRLRRIAKLRSDGGGEAQFRLLEELRACACATLRVPRPVAWFEEAGALVTEPANGEPLRALDPARDAGALRRVGRALAELHALPLEPGEPRGITRHLAELVRPSPDALAQALPIHAAVIRRTLVGLAADEVAWGALSAVPLHRDFHLRQLFDDGTHVTVLDWDDAASGDAAFDVGYFTAYLRTHHGRPAAEAGIAAFREGYGGEPELWTRVPSYERFNYLRRACRRFRLRDAGWERSLEAMLARLG